MFGFGGLSEVLFILVLALLIFGPEKLPEIARMLAKGMNEVRKASNELKRTLNAELAVSEQEQETRRAMQSQPPTPPAPPAWSSAQTVPQPQVAGAPFAPAEPSEDGPVEGGPAHDHGLAATNPADAAQGAAGVSTHDAADLVHEHTGGGHDPGAA